MTVCIAAIADHNSEQPKLVLCTDGKGSTSLGSKEVTLKNRIVDLKWRCLTAGGDNDLNAFVPLLGHEFAKLRKDDETVDETNVVPAVRAALKARKLERCDEFIQGRYGLSYAEFIRDGKQQFPEDQFRADMFTLGQLELNIDCIVAGFQDDGFPIILKLDGKGAVTVEEDFAVSGEGGYLAMSGLMHRQHYDVLPLANALYAVYEAKRYAERVNSVNDHTHLSIMSKNGGIEMITPAGLAYLRSLYQKYSPQPISDPVKIEPTFFMRPSWSPPPDASSS